MFDVIAKAGYVATEVQIEQLARGVQTGTLAASCYLRVVLVACQTQLGSPRRGRKNSEQGKVLDAVHKRFYPHVLRGVGPEELDALERNRRATFARTATSTIRSFIKSGGDLRALDATTASKGALRALTTPVVLVQGGTRDERTIAKARGAIERALERMAKGTPEGARSAIEVLLDALETRYEELGGAEKPEVAPSAPRGRVGGPALHS